MRRGSQHSSKLAIPLKLRAKHICFNTLECWESSGEKKHRLQLNSTNIAFLQQLPWTDVALATHISCLESTFRRWLVVVSLFVAADLVMLTD